MSKQKNSVTSKEQQLQSQVRELEENINFLEQIISIVPGHLYWKDLNSTLLGCNDEQAKDAGLSSRHDIVGLTPIDLIDKNQPEAEQVKQAEKIKEIDREVIKKNQSITAEETAVLPDGSVETFLSIKVPLHNKAGEAKGLVGISIDITDRKNMEESLKLAKKAAEQASEAKSDFLRDMGHDLRTPLGAIEATADALAVMIKNSETKKLLDDITATLNQKTKMDDNKNQLLNSVNNLVKQLSSELDSEREMLVSALNTIKDSSESMLDFLGQLLDYIRLSSGKLVSHKEPTNIQQLVESVFRKYKPSTFTKSISLTTEILSKENNLPELVLVDSHRLERVLMNLVNNAIKYTQEGFVKVITSFEYTRKPYGNLVLTVHDSGEGIPENKIDEIFEVFSQVHATDKAKGYGIGLGIVKHGLKDLKGTIDVKSVLSQGSDFTIKIPVKVISQ